MVRPGQIAGIFHTLHRCTFSRVVVVPKFEKTLPASPSSAWRNLWRQFFFFRSFVCSFASPCQKNHQHFGRSFSRQLTSRCVDTSIDFEFEIDCG